jgi:hypothetical protein
VRRGDAMPSAIGRVLPLWSPASRPESRVA